MTNVSNARLDVREMFELNDLFREELLDVQLETLDVRFEFFEDLEEFFGLVHKEAWQILFELESNSSS